jgi:hypothetical protein
VNLAQLQQNIAMATMGQNMAMAAMVVPSAAFF